MGLYRHYSMQEVELLLGIPRTTVRHYIDKGLVEVERDDENGYQQFTFNNLVQLSQIVYYREMMGYSLDSIEELLNSQQFETVEQIANKATRRLRAEIEKKQQQLNMLEYNAEIMKRHREFRDQMALIPFGKVYSLPFAYYVQSTHPLWRVLHGASEFTFDGEEFHHSRLRCLIFERDIDRLPQASSNSTGVKRRSSNMICACTPSTCQRKTCTTPPCCTVFCHGRQNTGSA